MPVYLDNIPEDLYWRIEQLASVDHLPLSEETVRLLRQAVELKQQSGRGQVLDVLEEMRRNRIVPAPGAPDGVQLLREDRER